MKNLIIIGARGFGREICWTAENCFGYNEAFLVKGFLDDKADALDGYWDQYPPILSSVEDYVPHKDDLFICALGDPVYRKKYTDIILAKNGNFINLVEKNAVIHPSVKLGYGNVISNYCSISCDVQIGNCNVLHRDVVIGHDCTIGDYNFFGTRTFIGGGVTIGDFASLNPGCSVYPHITVEDSSIVGANSSVIKRVKANTTVIGVPAKILKF